MDDYLDCLDRLRESFPFIADYGHYRRVLSALRKEFPLVKPAHVRLVRTCDEWAKCWYDGKRFQVRIFRTGIAYVDAETLLHEWAHLRVWAAEEIENHCATWAAEYGKLYRWYLNKFLQPQCGGG